MIKTFTKGAGDQFKIKKWRFITKLLKCINEKGLSSNHGVKVILYQVRQVMPLLDEFDNFLKN